MATEGDPEDGYVSAHNISVNIDPASFAARPYLYLTGVTNQGFANSGGIMILKIIEIENELPDLEMVAWIDERPER